MSSKTIYFLYNLLLALCTVTLLPLIGMVLILRKKYRCGIFQKCGLGSWSRSSHANAPSPVWVHAVSVGEVMAALPLLREMQREYPEIPIALSTVTETGHQTARRHAKGVDRIFYFPFDYPLIVKKVVSCLRPRAFLAIEAEIWPNLLRELKRRQVPSMIVSGRISKNSFKNYYFFKAFFSRVLGNISHFCMQTGVDAERIQKIGAASERITVTGSIKFDQHAPAVTSEQKESIFKALQTDSRRQILIAGSTHRGEEEALLEVYIRLKQQISSLLLILAPRHPERFDEVEQLLRQRPVNHIRKTALGQATLQEPPQVILLDTIGELATLYSIGTIIFIGGSMVPVGGHNVLEPAAFSKPVIFGKHMENFTEIASILIEKDAAIQVADQDQLLHQALHLLENPERCRQVGEAAFRVIQENSGALNKSMKILGGLLDRHTSTRT